MCVLSVKVPIQKKSGNLLNDPRIFITSYPFQYLFHLSEDTTTPMGLVHNTKNLIN